MYPIQLSGRTVTVREFRSADIDAVHGIVSDDRVTTWLSFDSRDRAQAEAMVEGAILRAQDIRRSEYYLAIDVPRQDRMAGFLRLALDGVAAGKLGYVIAADHWGHGYASEATALVTGFAFDTLQLHRVSAAIGPENGASIAVAQKLGMSYEGRIRHHVLTNGAWRDSLLYSVLADEWRRRAALPVLDPEGDWEHGAAG